MMEAMLQAIGFEPKMLEDLKHDVRKIAELNNKLVAQDIKIDEIMKVQNQILTNQNIILAHHKAQNDSIDFD